MAPKAAPTAPKKSSSSKAGRRCILLAYVLVLAGVWLSPVGFVRWQYAVHQTARIHLVENAMSVSQSEAILRLVQDSALWDNQEESQLDLPTEEVLPTKEVRVHDMPAMLIASQPTVDRMLGLLRRLYDLDDEQMRLRDLYVVKYDNNGVSGLPIHDDECTLSFSLALSRTDSYEGGGLQFDNLQGEPLRGKQGTAVFFPSKLLYRRMDINRGAEFALVGMVSVEKDDTWTFSPRCVYHDSPAPTTSNTTLVVCVNSHPLPLSAGYFVCHHSLTPYSPQHPRASVSARIHGMFARCIAVVSVDALSDDLNETAVMPERCFGWIGQSLRHALVRLQVLWRVASSEDWLHLVVLNTCLFGGWFVINKFMSR